MKKCGVCGQLIAKSEMNCRGCSNWAARIFEKFAKKRVVMIDSEIHVIAE